jgi:hypothetical protein
MKILYITNHKLIYNQSGGYLNDYLNDLLFYGLTEMEGIEVVDSTPIIHLYKENINAIPTQNLWGYGFNSTFLIDEDKVDRNNIEEKIENNFYDFIIYGSVKRCLDYYELVSKHYPNDKIILIDGDDFPQIHPLSSKHPYFKREIYNSNEKLIPIHFAIPQSKITKNKLDKTQEYGSIIPGQGGYKFNNEFEYGEDYNKSYYGVTMKKAGWDCMRHYEILSNNCIPYFPDLENCHTNTLTNLPKLLLIEGRELAKNFNEKQYYNILNELFEFTKNNLTTKQLAKYVIERIN